MSNLKTLSDAQVVLLAAHFISDINVESLQLLAAERKDVLTHDLIYRLLLTLYPSNDTARSALLALLRTIRTDFIDVSQLDSPIDVSTVTKLLPNVASGLASRLQLARTEREEQVRTNDTLVDFIIAWSHQVESTDGALEELVPLVEELIPENSILKRWSEAYLLPIVRLQYYYYPSEADHISLHELETSSGPSGIRALLRCAERYSAQAQISRDLGEVVAPWIEGADVAETQLSRSWNDVYEWILATSLTDFSLAAKALLEWDGPPSLRASLAESGPEDLAAYAQTAFAVVYADRDASENVLHLSQSILRRFGAMVGASVADVSVPDPEITGTSPLVADISVANLLKNALLSRDNKLTRPSEGSVAFMAGVLKTADILTRYKVQLNVGDVTRVCISASEELQNQELRRVLHQLPQLTSADPDWQSIRQQLLWLRSWRNASADDSLAPSAGAFLGRLSQEHVEESLLGTMLSMGHYGAAKRIYLDPTTSPLDASTIEKHVVAAIYSAYDNASNGNRSRGGMKRASELLATFRPLFPESQTLRDIEHLLKATHSLSFYQLASDHGVPFRPVNIRAQKDPLSLIARVLAQDPKAYTKLDDLLEIGSNLVLSHFQDKDVDFDEPAQSPTRLGEAEQRVTYLAIMSALASHDFDTAYSYITTRLSTSPVDSQTLGDDISWRAAYAAGRYRPANPQKALHDRISSLSKRMDLLSLALTLAPHPDTLSEILGQWRRCEEEMDTLKAHALEEERAFEVNSDDTMPGGFDAQDQDRDAEETRRALAKRALAGTTATYEEEAPMGLFDVARGAATALRKSAFPLNAGSVKDLKIRDSDSRNSSDASAPRSPVTEDGSGRVRKRDMVSNALVSGMGWVLGAQPVNKADAEDD